MKPLPTLFWPLAVGGLLLALTAWLWSHERESQQQRLMASFEFGQRQTATRIVARLSSYEQMLRGLRGLHEASDEITEADFTRYVQVLATGADFAGLRALGYAPLQQGGTRAPLTYLAPAGGPAMRALGTDVLSHPALQRALAQAGDAGTLALSAPVREPSSTADASPGFVLLMALYRPAGPLDAAVQRRQRLLGWVMASFHVSDLMSSLYGEDLPGLEIKLFDGPDTSDAACIYASPVQAGAAGRTPRLKAQEYLSVGGHTWTLVVRSTPAFEDLNRGDRALDMALAGCLLSVLAALLTWQLLTARDRAHAAAEQMTGQLRDGAERYRRIVETANEGIWMLDDAGHTRFANARLYALLGATPQDLTARNWLDHLDEASRRVWLEEMLGPLQQGHALQRDLCLSRADGSALWATVSVSPVQGEGAGYAGALVMVTDITARHQAETQRALLEGQLLQSQKMEAIGTLAGGIAHDFNNITAAILGNLALGRDALTPEQAAAAKLDAIQAAAERGRNLVQQITAFSRRQAPVRTRQALAPLVQEAVALLRTTLPARVQLNWSCSNEPLVVLADPTQMQQVLMNLCTNAWHALGEQPGHVDIALDALVLDDSTAMAWALAAGRYAQLRVSDNGSGMDEATLSRVFEPFFTTKPKGQGTGLGLSVVHGIVTAHGGAIRVHSTPGQGSSFHILLPLAPSGDEQAQACGPGAGLALRGQGQQVLVVDDDPVVLAMVDGLLTMLGYRVLSMNDGRQALERALQQDDPVAAVVSDFNMPLLSGLELARAIHEHRPGLPVLLSSGYVTDELRTDALHAGVRHVMQKEFTLEQLGPLLYRVLNENTP